MSTDPNVPASPDLDECAREPIHIPGSIQPHGVLLVTDAAGERIVQASANAATLFGRAADALLGTPWRELFTLTSADEAAGEVRPWHAPWIPVALPGGGSWAAALHSYADCQLIELEPQVVLFDEDPVRQGYELNRRLERDLSIETAAERAAKWLRQVLGYDRVMVYRFDPAWNGEVIAEAAAAHLEPYLGLNYPASDIPAQARALYLRNRVRSIGDVAYRPCPIEPRLHPGTGLPTDLSDVALRSVSPVHVEYLSNMGVSATLVASIVVAGQLWGLLSCHHYAPLPADHQMRELADVVARVLATRIGALQALAQVEMESHLATVREKLITALAEADSISAELLAELAPELLEAVDADGVAIFAGTQVYRHGQTPAADALRRIRAAIAPAADLGDAMSGVFHCEALGARFPELADLAGLAAGALYLPLTVESHNAILWLRHERVRDVRWGGNPYLSKLQVIPGARLSPRQSFAAWQETVRGRSRPWAPLHLESARGLRVMIELMERKHYQQHFALMRRSLEQMHAAVLIVEATPGTRWRHARIVLANPSFGRLAGLDVAGLAGRRAVEALALDTDALDAFETALASRHRAVLTLQLASAARALQFDVEPIRDADERVTHWMAVQRLE